jgi:NADPH2:quinone reductase
MAPLTFEYPLILGSEATGVVEQIGPGVTNIAVGDRVAAPMFVGGRLDGAYAEQVAVDANLLVPLPDVLSFELAAGVLLQGLTALWLIEHVPATNRTVLIHAAAGGVGSLLVQIVKLRSAARVIATASTPAKLALARRRGADMVVNYTQPDWLDQIRAATEGRGPDVIYDPVGGDIRRRSLDLLAPKGTLVIYGWAATGSIGALDDQQLMGLYVKNQFVTAFSGWSLFTEPGLLARSYAELFELVIAGTLDVQVDRRYSLSEAAEAHRALAARETTGKIVLIP